MCPEPWSVVFGGCLLRIVMSLSALLLVASIAPAQSTSSPFICQTSAGVPPVVRAESRTEIVGDYVVMCSGGTQGQPVTASFTMFLNTNVTSRVLSDNGTSEALLLVDEPGSAQQAVGVNVFAAKKGPQGENSLSIRGCSIYSTRQWPGTHIPIYKYTR